MSTDSQPALSKNDWIEANKQQSLGVSSMLQAIIEKGITPENAAALEQLVGLYERMEAKRAEREFASAMVALKQEMPAITADKPVPNRDGTVRYCYAPLESIDSVLRPAALKHGFSYSFSQQPADIGRVTKLCVVKHVGGHSESTPFTVRVGGGPPGSSEAQGDGAAATYAQRRALCDAFGIIVESDRDGADDARNEGAVISQKEAIELKEWAEAVGTNIPTFLAIAGAANFESISRPKLEVMQNLLRTKEKAKSRGQ